MEKNSTIIMVAAKLHNFVIDNDNIDFKTACSFEDFGVEPLVDGPDNNHGYFPTLPTRDEIDTSDGSARRQWIVGEIKSRDMRRPLYNILRSHDSNLLDDNDSVYEEEEQTQQHTTSSS